MERRRRRVIEGGGRDRGALRVPHTRQLPVGNRAELEKNTLSDSMRKSV